MSLEIGQLVEGGIVFYVDATGENGLVAASLDQPAGNWSTNLMVTGATDILVGTGQINTDKILAVNGAGNYAASKCADLEIDGFDDWYLPSRQELELMLFHSEMLLTSKYYGRWSSTEEGGGYAYIVDFTEYIDPNIYIWPKTGHDKTRRFRPIRMVGSFEPFDIADLNLPVRPTSETISVTNILEKSATVTINVTDDGGSPLLAKGVSFNTTGNPYIGNGVLIQNAATLDTGEESFQIAGLEGEKNYYIAAFARNAAGTKYGNVLQFRSGYLYPGLTLQTLAATSITNAGATLRGNISRVGDPASPDTTQTELGFFLSTTPNIIMDNARKVLVSNKWGDFSISLNDLLPNTTYYFSAYCLTNYITLQTERSFKTLSAQNPGGGDPGSGDPDDGTSTPPVVKPIITGNMIISSSEELARLTGSFYENNEFSRIETDVLLEIEALTEIVGRDIYDLAFNHYQSDNYGVAEFEHLNNLVQHIQLPVALMSTFRYYQSNIMSHEDSGRKLKVDKQTEATPWEWMLDRDDDAQLRKAYSATDRLIKFLDNAVFDQWIGSAKQRATKNLFVNNAAVFHNNYPIDESPRFYYTLVPFIAEVQRNYIAKVLGKAKYDQLLAAFQTNNTSTSDNVLIELIQQAIPLATMAIAVKRLSLKVLPEGVVQQFKSMMQGRSASQPALLDMIQYVADDLKKDAQLQLDLLKKELNKSNPDALIYNLLPKNDESNKYFSL